MPYEKRIDNYTAASKFIHSEKWFVACFVLSDYNVFSHKEL